MNTKAEKIESTLRAAKRSTCKAAAPQWTAEQRADSRTTRVGPVRRMLRSPLRSSGPQSGPPEGRLLRSPRRSRGPILGPVRLARFKRSPSPLRSSGPQSGPPEGLLLRSPRRSRGPILGPVRLARFKRSPTVRRSPLRKKKYDHGV